MRWSGLVVNIPVRSMGPTRLQFVFDLIISREIHGADAEACFLPKRKVCKILAFALPEAIRGKAGTSQNGVPLSSTKLQPWQMQHL